MQDLRTVRRRAVATVAATALAATALAGPAAAAGPSFPLSFIGIYKNGSPVKAKKFQFAGAPVSCAEGTTTYGTSRPLPANWSAARGPLCATAAMATGTTLPAASSTRSTAGTEA